MAKCFHCGKVLRDAWANCPMCGHQIDNAKPTAQRPDPPPWETRYETLFSELWKEGYTPKEIHCIAKNMKLIVAINHPKALATKSRKESY